MIQKPSLRISLLGLLLIGLLVWLSQQFAWVERDVWRGWPSITPHHDYQIAQAFLHKKGIDTTIYTDVSSFNIPKNSQDTVFLQQAEQGLTVAQQQQLQRWVSAGGRLVFYDQNTYDRERTDQQASSSDATAAQTDWLTDLFGLRNTEINYPCWEDEYSPELSEKGKSSKAAAVPEYNSEILAEFAMSNQQLQRLCQQITQQTAQDYSTILLDQQPYRVATTYSVMQFTIQPNAQPNLKIRQQATTKLYGDFLVEIRYGEGQVVMLATDFQQLFEDGSIKPPTRTATAHKDQASAQQPTLQRGDQGIHQYDHVSLLSYLARNPNHKNGSQSLKWLTSNQHASWWTLLWQHAPWLLLCLLGLVGLLIWRSMPRFGPLLHVQNNMSRDLLAHIDTSGHYYWQQQQVELLLDAVRQPIWQAIQRIYPAQPLNGISQHRLTAQLADRTQLSIAQLDAALFSTPTSEAAFSSCIKTLQKLRTLL